MIKTMGIMHNTASVRGLVAQSTMALAEKRFVFSSALSVDDMKAQINGYGLSVRDARVATGGLQEFVGAVVELVDPPVEEPEA